MTGDVHLQAETTASTREEAEQLARAMVHRRLAACAQVVGPIRSVYWWEGDVADEEEFLVLFKTRADLADAFRAQLAALHPYDVPEILLFEVRDGHRPYLDWISAETRAPQAPDG